MKVLEINSVCGIKSTGRICTDIADVLRKEGHSCMVAYGRENVPDKYKGISYRIGSNISVKTDAFLTRIFDNAGFNSKKATKDFIKWAKEYDPDIIHLHNIHGYYINIEILFKWLKEAGKPVIWTLHDCWTFTGHCAHFVNAGCEKWKTGCFSCPKKKAYPKSQFSDNSKKNYEKKKKIFTSLENLTIVTPSEWLASQVRESFLGKYEVKVINNGIDTDVFKPTESDFSKKYNIENKKIILGVASAWSKSKGLYDFHRLSELLSDNEIIVLVGLTEEQINTLPENVIGIKRTNSKEELAGIYSAADIFLNLTYADTYPTVNLEAQSCGTPVITYRTGGSVESVPAENVVEQGDIESVVKMLDKELEIKNCDRSNGNMVNGYAALLSSYDK